VFQNEEFAVMKFIAAHFQVCGGQQYEKFDSTFHMALYTLSVKIEKPTRCNN
jgi:hypothetical protein